MALFRVNTLCIARKSDEIRAQIFRKMPKADCAVLPYIFLAPAREGTSPSPTSKPSDCAFFQHFATRPLLFQLVSSPLSPPCQRGLSPPQAVTGGFFTPLFPVGALHEAPAALSRGFLTPLFPRRGASRSARASRSPADPQRKNLRRIRVKPEFAGDFFLTSPR